MAVGLPRQLYALIMRDLRQIAVNPVCGSFAAFCLLVVLIFGIILDAGDDSLIGAMVVACALGTALACNTTTPTAFVLSEEWEHGTFPAMLAVGIAPAAIALARLIVSVAATTVYCAIMLWLATVLVPTFPPACILPLTLASVPAALAMSAASLGLMLIARSTQHLHTCCAPATISYCSCMLQPFIGIAALELLPAGPLVALMQQLVYGVESAFGWPVLIAAAAAWLAAGLIVLGIGIRSFARALQGERAG